MPLDTLPDANQEPIKRGPGRPRKERHALPGPAPPVDTRPRVTGRCGAGRMLGGKSVSTIKRLEKSDPDWPKPFAVGGPARNNYLISDIEQYLLKKAKAASEKA